MKIYPLFFGENTFFGLVVCSYADFSLLIIDLLMLIKGVYDGEDGKSVGASTIICLTISMIAYCYFLNRFPYYFGDFKKKFEKHNICAYFYSFVLLEKFLSSIVIILLRNVSFGLIFEVMIICTQLTFVAIRNPYICGDYRRPLINTSISALSVFFVFLNNILPSVSYL